MITSFIQLFLVKGKREHRNNTVGNGLDMEISTIFS